MTIFKYENKPEPRAWALLFLDEKKARNVGILVKKQAHRPKDRKNRAKDRKFCPYGRTDFPSFETERDQNRLFEMTPSSRQPYSRKKFNQSSIICHRQPPFLNTPHGYAVL